jgi:ubiquinone biosynthesis accessory factor UbiK
MLNSAENGTAMPQSRIIEDLSARLGEIIAAGPAKDVEKNLRAMLSAAFAKFDLATREELGIQAKVLARTREKLSELEARIAELEAGLRKQ